MEIREPIGDDELREAIRVVRAALLFAPLDEAGFERVVENRSDRDALAMFDDGSLVGHVAAFRFDTTVPGGARVPTAGVTAVGVLPTHTRRGVLTRLMDQLLRDCHERGQAIASLRASETPIYGRFGFGLGGDLVSAVINRDGTRPLRTPAAPGSFRLLAGDEPLAVVPPIYERAARRRVGTINRYGWHWKRILDGVNRPQSLQEENPGVFVAVHTSPDGDDDGYVMYSTCWAEGFGESWRAEGKVLDLWGIDEAVERALWQYLFDVDLVVTWRAADRPVDDAIRRTIHNARAYHPVHVNDEQWVRVLDVDAALAARKYGAASAEVRLGVDDPLFDGNCGTWEVTSAGARRSSGPADVTVEIAALGAAYLGGVSWFDLRASGEIDSATDDATLSALDALFRVHPLPFCGTDF